MDHWTKNYFEEENNLSVAVTVQSTLFSTVTSLKEPDDVATKVLDTEIFSQGNIAGLISGITFIILFSQNKPLR